LKKYLFYFLVVFAVSFFFFISFVQAARSDGLDTELELPDLCGKGGTEFIFAATGDTFPHENIQAVGQRKGYDYLFDYVRPYLKVSDISYTNFDGAMLKGSPQSAYPMFNYNPALAKALKNAGIGVVSIANNHILDRGPKGLDATIGVLNDAGILHHGSVTSTESKNPPPPYLPIMISRDGVDVKIGFISATWGTNGNADPFRQVSLLWNSNQYGKQSGPIRQEVLDAVRKAKKETDFVVVAAHWGVEYQFYPHAGQIDGAKQLAKAGADVILGAQPHTLQPVDLLEVDGRKVLVVYSLANFIASQGMYQAKSYSATSVIFYFTFVKEKDGAVHLSGYRYLPTIHVDKDTRPAPIKTDELRGVQEHVRLIMRDFSGKRQIQPDPSKAFEQIATCPVQEITPSVEGGVLTVTPSVGFFKMAMTVDTDSPSDSGISKISVIIWYSVGGMFLFLFAYFLLRHFVK